MPPSLVRHSIRQLLALCFAALWSGTVSAELRTWDSKHSIDTIDVTMVYFVPRDRVPLPDWQERVRYFARRIEQFHQREFQGQSTLSTHIHATPFLSQRSTDMLREGDATFIYLQTLREVATELPFPPAERAGFPVLLVLSDINWRALEDFYRLRRIDGKLTFEGQFQRGRHFPGAESGGARASYFSEPGYGWGLVSADGWRVPYSGTDCVVYHEGVGHPVGLPHPDEGNGSVMSLAQYRGWISESWVDDDQKERLGWKGEQPVERSDLFSKFRAIPEPLVPRPQQLAGVRFDWPANAQVKQLRVRWQTDVFGPWQERPITIDESAPPPTDVPLVQFDRATPVSYRVDVELVDGQRTELWGYFQVREKPDQLPLPPGAVNDLSPTAGNGGANAAARPNYEQTIDLLAKIDPEKHAVVGNWTRTEAGQVDSPKQYGARLEIPYQPPEEYEMVVIAEALDEPNGLILGQRSGEQRFLSLMNFLQREGPPAHALENIDGRNVNNNATTRRGVYFVKGRPFQVVCTVRKASVTVHCDGQEVIHWTGDRNRLSLSDYWKTPRNEALFLGAYDCRYRFHRISLTPISGTGRELP